MDTAALLKAQIKGVPKKKYTLDVVQAGKSSVIELAGSFKMAKPISNALGRAGFKLTKKAVLGTSYNYWSKDKFGNTAKTVYDQAGSKHFSLTLKENKPIRIGPKGGKYRLSGTGKKSYKRR